MNEVHLTGQIKRIWTYNDNLYLRLSVRRDPGRPRRSAKDGGMYDYVTVVFANGKGRYAFQENQLLTVHGWLQSRDFDETLADFLKRADGDAPAVSAEDAARIAVHRSIIEVVAERWLIHDNGGEQPDRVKQHERN